MNALRLIFCIFCLQLTPYLHANQAYLDRFMAYMSWHQQLPTTASPAFLAFIHEKTYLSQKLREQWLYHLAQTNDWSTFIQNYELSADTSLQCYLAFAYYQQGQKTTALKLSRSLWLTGESQPPACDKLFTLLLKDHVFEDDLIYQRVKLVLEKRNFNLADYLLKRLNHPSQASSTLEKIHQHPSQITQLTSGHLTSEFYLYGLKKLLLQNLQQANQLWQQALNTKLLSEKQQQEFLSQVAILKALRNQTDAPHWFAKIKQEFMTEPLLEWRIRFALKQYQWPKVELLIKQSANQATPCWQYWLARSIEAQGRETEARALYQKLAENRHYYGFLSSLRLKQPFAFQHEEASPNPEILTIYQPIIKQIKMLYAAKQITTASVLVNDFTSELPTNEKSAFIHWLAKDLNWISKSVYLSNQEDLANQLSLRFPLAYQDEIKRQSAHYQVPEALIYAVIRQESAFREDVVSFAGAHGLMQLMPKTASWISKIKHIAYTNQQQLFSSPQNIHLGVAYLGHLSAQYHHHWLLVVAAYNAGPRQVRGWLNTLPLKQPDIWIETIPFSETRNYLKSVISFYLVYQHQLKQTPSLDLFMKPYDA